MPLGRPQHPAAGRRARRAALWRVSSYARLFCVRGRGGPARPCYQIKFIFLSGNWMFGHVATGTSGARPACPSPPIRPLNRHICIAYFIYRGRGIWTKRILFYFHLAARPSRHRRRRLRPRANEAQRRRRGRRTCRRAYVASRRRASCARRATPAWKDCWSGNRRRPEMHAHVQVVSRL